MSENTKKSEMRWGVEKRMEFIEFCLFWEGGLNRSDLVERFGISAPQASNDLSSYKGVAPQNIDYDLSSKRYFASKKFKPLYLRPDADRYLSQLRLVTDHLLSLEETWLSTIPNVDSIPVPHRKVDVGILKSLLKAVRKQRALMVNYQSMNEKRPDPLWRWISPHAFVNDGMRWHLRAFCHVENKFKDFLISRLLEVGEEGEPGAYADQDKAWQEFIKVILIPNPKLSKGQREIIAMDYGMEDSKLSLQLRKAVLYYFKKRLRLDVAEVLDNPNESPLVIENSKEFEAALSGANAS